MASSGRSRRSGGSGGVCLLGSIHIVVDHFGYHLRVVHHRCGDGSRLLGCCFGVYIWLGERGLSRRSLG